ncbi:cyclase family protein [Mesoterricola sediminis]|uniref:Kynurenine formamidase n=1 Tax=Mesoterricola sediminis TaxID=2927980 RepID=A0AA48KDG1_9BACT|nr:cyclase family protein [Mesoterricola sediminis]BDU78171.1 kynurenine formamidase [Mesoterricola sediminis]
MLYDVTAPLSSRLAVWPGDTGFQRKVGLSLDAGDWVTTSTFSTTSHAGTHADAPAHVVPGAPAMDQVDLAAYFGPCEVIAVDLPPRARILPEHLPHEPRAPRVLFRTGSYPDPEAFRETFNALSPDLVNWLADRGCRLVGLDTPSVDPFDSAALESHHALFARDLRCLEGLRLDAVPPGLYFLSALPLRIEGGDGSPVRAILATGVTTEL